MNPKTLFLVRHAKSSWDSDVPTDHERPLNKRGLHDAPMMGRRLADSGVMPDLIICSSAARAQMTARLIATEIGYEESQIEIITDIYGAGAHGLREIIQGLDPSLNQIMLVGHNPDITELVNWLSRANIGNIPTCGITTLQISSDSWEDFTAAAAELVQYDFPKRV
ncbi:MAG: histidine phosphatase family protein [Gammaproteobacteria bacterium]|nr:histidine phosphatase family protein [Gammaproteobacteria bacterium]